MIKRNLRAPLVCVLCLSLLSACAGRSAREAAPALLEPVAASVDMVPVTRGDVLQLRLFEGTVTAYSEGLYFQATDAPLFAVHAAPGQAVAAGELLAELDRSAWQTRYDAAESALSFNETTWAHTNRQMEIAIERQELAYAAAPGDYEQTLAAYALRETREALAYEQETQTIERERLSAQLAALEARRGDYEIRAPFDGVVMHIEGLVPGAYPAARAPFLYLCDPARLTIQCGDSAIAGALVTAKTFAAAIGDEEYAIERADYTAAEKLAYFFAKATMPARFRLADESKTLPADKRVLIKLYGDARSDTLTLLPNAVRQDLGAEEDRLVRQYFVYVDENGARVRRNVKCGLISEIAVEILEGLEEGELVYVDE